MPAFFGGRCDDHYPGRFGARGLVATAAPIPRLSRAADTVDARSRSGPFTRNGDEV